MIGPGTCPLNVQAAYRTPGAISMVRSSTTILTCTTGPGGASGRTTGSARGNAAAGLPAWWCGVTAATSVARGRPWVGGAACDVFADAAAGPCTAQVAPKAIAALAKAR